MSETSIKDFAGVRIGNAENVTAATGCTVFIFPEGAAAGLSVRGGGPASRESELLKSLAAADRIHSVLLSGGSAFGLDAAGGVMRYLEERNIGFDAGGIIVPLVCQSCLFDLTVADGKTRPDAEMGYEACVNSEDNNYSDGNHGAGTGCTVGKMYGMSRCMKSGIGSYAVRLGDFMAGAVVALNALGDVYDWKTAHKIAGALSDDGRTFARTDDAVYGGFEGEKSGFAWNTTLAVFMTNAKFRKSQLCKIADMSHDGLARSIRPVHTGMDGDSIYAVSLGDFEADVNAVGSIAADVIAEAVKRAVYSAESAYGYPSAKSIS